MLSRLFGGPRAKRDASPSPPPPPSTSTPPAGAKQGTLFLQDEATGVWTRQHAALLPPTLRLTATGPPGPGATRTVDLPRMCHVELEPDTGGAWLLRLGLNSGERLRLRSHGEAAPPTAGPPADMQAWHAALFHELTAPSAATSLRQRAMEHVRAGVITDRVWHTIEDEWMAGGTTDAAETALAAAVAAGGGAGRRRHAAQEIHTRRWAMADQLACTDGLLRLCASVLDAGTSEEVLHTLGQVALQVSFMHMDNARFPPNDPKHDIRAAMGRVHDCTVTHMETHGALWTPRCRAALEAVDALSHIMFTASSGASTRVGHPSASTSTASPSTTFGSRTSVPRPSCPPSPLIAPKQAPVEPKRTLEASYTLQTVLGKGCSGTVRLATRHSDGRVFAVKCMPKGAARGSTRTPRPRTGTQWALREMLVSKDLQHDNIVNFVDFFDMADVVHLVFEYMNCGDLQRAVMHRGAVSEVTARHVLQSVLRALEYLHSQHVVHRDVKPENILVSRDGAGRMQFKLADFGFARHVPPGGCKEQCGTRCFVAPEIVNGKPYDTQVDMWSLGCVAFALLCGRTPFWHADKSKVLPMVRRGEFTFNAEPWQSVSQSAKDFVTSLLCLDPDKRLTAAEALRHPWVANTMTGPTALSAANARLTHFLSSQFHVVRRGELNVQHRQHGAWVPIPMVLTSISLESVARDSHRWGGVPVRSIRAVQLRCVVAGCSEFEVMTRDQRHCFRATSAADAKAWVRTLRVLVERQHAIAKASAVAHSACQARLPRLIEIADEWDAVLARSLRAESKGAANPSDASTAGTGTGARPERMDAYGGGAGGPTRPGAPQRARSQGLDHACAVRAPLRCLRRQASEPIAVGVDVGVPRPSQPRAGAGRPDVAVIPELSWSAYASVCELPNDDGGDVPGAGRL